MAKRACVASSTLLGLTAVILLGLALDGSKHRASEVQVFYRDPHQRQDIRNDSTVNELHSNPWASFVVKAVEPCKPQKNIVFLKTHKTAGTTTAGIIDMYAYKNHLTMGVPPNDRPYMHRTKLFQQDMMRKTTKSMQSWRKNVGFNVLSSHARYNKPEMDAVVHNAKYISILRDPATQFVSAFLFYHFDERFKQKFKNSGQRYTNVVEEFMKNPEANMKLIAGHPLEHVLHNQQFFDLGLDTKYADDWDTIDATIARLDWEIDLVLITEHYDESLILMRDLLCWSTEDILYTSRKVRNSSSALSVSPETQQKIRQWNAADRHLYDHYNRTLWQRIAQYGPSFNEELRKFRLRLQSVTEEETGSHRSLVKQITRRMQKKGIVV